VLTVLSTEIGLYHAKPYLQYTQEPSIVSCHC